MRALRCVGCVNNLCIKVRTYCLILALAGARGDEFLVSFIAIVEWRQVSKSTIKCISRLALLGGDLYMAHRSEDSTRLRLKAESINDITQLTKCEVRTPKVYLLWLPIFSDFLPSAEIRKIETEIANFCKHLDGESTVCIMTEPKIAAGLVTTLSDVVTLRHWIAVKKSLTNDDSPCHLPNQHAALLIFTRYTSGLKHTRTRIEYTYCPACKKTTKDYGGKAHVYDEYGTSISDVWRDIELNLNDQRDLISSRLRDVFGLAPYKELKLFDLSDYSRGISAAGNIRAAKRECSLVPKRTRLATNRLIHGDCLEELKRLPSNALDFAFVDLPYNLSKKYYSSNDNLETGEYFDWCERWLYELYRILKPNRTLALLNVPMWAARHFQYLSTLMEFQDWIVWEALSFPVRKIMPAHYAIVCFSKGKPRPLPGLQEEKPSEFQYLSTKGELFCNRPSCVSVRASIGFDDKHKISNLWYDVYRLTHNSRRVNHPCQLPPLLMRRLYALFTKRGEIVGDCCNGAGTSTLVAQEMKRRYIGIERSRRFHNLAVRRHEMLSEGVDPFQKHNNTPTLKNSPVQRLQKQKYQVTKKMLQLDVRRIARELGRIPTYEDVKRHSKHRVSYFKKYFVSWGEVCAAARIEGQSLEDARITNAAKI